MINIHVEDMHCEKCVERITKALEAIGIKAAVSLEKKIVSVEEAQVSTVIEELDDIGFTACL